MIDEEVGAAVVEVGSHQGCWQSRMGYVVARRHAARNKGGPSVGELPCIGGRIKEDPVWGNCRKGEGGGRGENKGGPDVGFFITLCGDSLHTLLVQQRISL